MHILRKRGNWIFIFNFYNFVILFHFSKKIHQIQDSSPTVLFASFVCGDGMTSVRTADMHWTWMESMWRPIFSSVKPSWSKTYMMKLLQVSRKVRIQISYLTLANNVKVSHLIPLVIPFCSLHMERYLWMCEDKWDKVQALSVMRTSPCTFVV